MKKPKKCRVCEKEFFPWSSTQVACSWQCAQQIARDKAQKDFQKETRRMKTELNKKDRSWQLARTQVYCNKYIRMRDEGQGCISCGSKTGKMNAGHYRSVGAMRDALRFEPDNIHLQCEKCNSYLSANIAAYRPALIEKIGLERVEWLEGDHKPVRLRIPDLEQIREDFKQKIKELESR